MLIVAPGEYSGFQVTGMIEWGQESKLPKKFPGASNKTLEILLTKNLPPPKNSMPNFRALDGMQHYAAWIWGHYQESSDCFEYPKNSQIVSNTQKNRYLNQATQKNTCQIFKPQKILRSFPSLKIRSPPSAIVASNLCTAKAGPE